VRHTTKKAQSERIGLFSLYGAFGLARIFEKVRQIATEQFGPSERTQSTRYARGAGSARRGQTAQKKAHPSKKNVP
jgi:hypothetical protein